MMTELPPDLVRAGLDAVRSQQKYHSIEADVRDVLAVVLPMHEQMVREQFVAELAELGIRIVPKAVDALWDCPTSPSRGQRAHSFGDPKEQWTECLNGCGMTWTRLQEATT